MASDFNKNAIRALLVSLLLLITTFQETYRNCQVLVTPNEMVGLYCHDNPLNDHPPFLSGLPVASTGIFIAKAVYMVLGSSLY